MTSTTRVKHVEMHFILTMLNYKDISDGRTVENSLEPKGWEYGYRCPHRLKHQMEYSLSIAGYYMLPKEEYTNHRHNLNKIITSITNLVQRSKDCKAYNILKVLLHLDYRNLYANLNIDELLRSVSHLLFEKHIKEFLEEVESEINALEDNKFLVARLNLTKEFLFNYKFSLPQCDASLYQ